MPSIRIGLNRVWEQMWISIFSRSAQVAEWKDFSNSESQVLAQCYLRFRRRCHSKNFKYHNGTILAILNLCRSDASHQVWLNPSNRLGGNAVLRISRWTSWQPSWILEWNNFSNIGQDTCIPESLRKTCCN